MTNQRVRRKADSKKSEHLQEYSVTPRWQPDKANCKSTWLPNREEGFACKEENPTRTICLHTVPTATALLSGTRFPVHVSTICSKDTGVRDSALACHAISFLSAPRRTYLHSISLMVFFIFPSGSGLHWDNQQAVDEQGPGPGFVVLLLSLQSAWDLEDTLPMLHDRGIRQPKPSPASALTHSLHPMPQSCSNHVPTLFFAAPPLIRSPTPNPISLFLLAESLQTPSTASGAGKRQILHLSLNCFSVKPPLTNPCL